VLYLKDAILFSHVIMSGGGFWGGFKAYTETPFENLGTPTIVVWRYKSAQYVHISPFPLVKVLHVIVL